MIRNCSLLRFLGVTVYFVAKTFATESIINGDIAEIDQFPYQVSLMDNKSNICGGGLITHQHVLTAAQCVITEQNRFKDLTDMRVLVGANHMKSISIRAMRIEIINIYVPKQFMHGNFVYDISVLKLKECFKVNSTQKYLKPLNLPPKHLACTYAGDIAKIAGFGWNWIASLDGNKFTGENLDHHLHYADAIILTDEICRNKVRDLKISITHKFICARVQPSDKIHENRGVCIGDNGSPLVSNLTVVGVLIDTGLHTCRARNSLAIYIRVSQYIKFIHYALEGGDHNDVRFLTENS